jgi:hypothetical protein
MNNRFRLISLVVLSILVSPIIYCLPNLVKNPSFEYEHNKWASDWLIRSYFEDQSVTDYILDQGNGHSGNRFLTVRNNIPNDARVYQYIEVKPSTVYRISGWIKSDGITGDTGGNIAVLDSFAMTPDVRNSNGVWQYVEMYGMTGLYQRKMPISVRFGSWTMRDKPRGTVSFDDITVEQVTQRPAGQIQSLSFNDPYNENDANKYFERVNNMKANSINVDMTLFLAMILFIASAGFAFYTLFLSSKKGTMKSFVDTVFTKYYHIFIALFFIIFFLVFLIDPNGIGVLDVRLFFIVLLVGSLGIGFYLYRIKALTPQNIAKIVVILGVGIRLCYFLYTDMNTRQHDLWGAWSHTAYIEYVANHFALPPVGTYETYHPPVHYILSAVVFKIAQLCRLPNDLAFRAVELFLVFLSTLYLIFAYKIFKLVKCDEKIKLVAIAFVCFLPNTIYMSVYLNNDPTLTLFYTVAFYYLLKWVDNRTMKNTILLAVFTAISILSKKSALAMLPLAGIVFVVELVKNRTEWKKFLVQGAVFLAIALPLGMSYQIRNYVLFQQDLSYAVPPLGTIMPDDPYKLFWVSVEKLLQQPISSQAPAEREYFVMELIRTALFEVFEWPGLKDIATVLMFFYLLNLLVMVIFIILFRKQDFSDKAYVFLLSLVVSLLLYWQMRSASPYDCTYAFRYLSPFISIPLGFFIGQGVIRFSSTKYPVFNVVIRAQFAIFCIMSAVFILAIGF